MLVSMKMVVDVEVECIRIFFFKENMYILITMYSSRYLFMWRYDKAFDRFPYLTRMRVWKRGFDS